MSAYEDLGSSGSLLEDAEVEIRRGFVQKVFGILAVQLGITFGVILLFSLDGPVQRYVDMRDPEAHQWPFFLALTTGIGCLLTLTCCSHQARVYPNNYVFLGIFTIAESVMLGVVCAAYALDSILIAVGMTAMLTLGLVAYATTTKRDFTGAGPYLFMALWMLMMYGLVLSFFPVLRHSVQTAYSLIGVVIFSFYVVFDVQLILGGKHTKYRFGVDEFVFAALSVYLDIVNLFLYFLDFFGRDRR
jgi:FtsH-binding integral membrane protein